MESLTLEKLLTVMRSVPRIPKLLPSKYVRRGEAYHVTREDGTEFVIAHPDDIEEFA